MIVLNCCNHKTYFSGESSNNPGVRSKGLFWNIEGSGKTN